MMNTPIKILVIDDHEMVIEGMRTLLSKIDGVILSATALNASDALQVLKSTSIDIAFADINMPDMNGIELGLKIKNEFPSVHVIALSSFVQRSYVAQMINIGASGYLTKSANKEEIEEAIQTVMNGKLYLSGQIGSVVIATNPEIDLPILTRREMEVLKLIAEGLTNKDIAEKLFVSPSTVDSHRKNLLAKFNAHNTATLITQASKSGFI